MGVGLKIHKRKTKYMTKMTDSKDILTEQEENAKVTKFKCLGQTTHLKDTTKKRPMPGLERHETVWE